MTNVFIEPETLHVFHNEYMCMFWDELPLHSNTERIMAAMAKRHRRLEKWTQDNAHEVKKPFVGRTKLMPRERKADKANGEICIDNPEIPNDSPDYI